MKEWPLGFEYTWSDLKPVRLLATTVVVGQLAGAGLGFVMARLGWGGAP